MKKRILAALMCVVMVLCLLPATAYAAYVAGTGAIQAGANGIPGYSVANTYNYIYYGEWNGAPIKWRVLDDKTNKLGAGLFLLSEDLFSEGLNGVEFASAYNGVAWQGSNAQAWCKDFAGESGTEVPDAFTASELAAILATTKGDDGLGSRYACDSFGDLSGDKLFFLSLQEAEKADYGFAANDDRVASYNGANSYYHLRSGSGGHTQVYISSDGSFSQYHPVNSRAVRPAFNLDNSKVLLASAAAGGKSASSMDGALTAVSPAVPTEWKLTLYDSERSSFTASTTAVNGDVLTVSYSGAKTGSNEYISAIVADADDNITHYGRIASPAAASGTVDINKSLMGPNDTLYVFSEQYNSGNCSDYASDFQLISMTPAPPASPALESGYSSFSEPSDTFYGGDDGDEIKVKLPDGGSVTITKLGKTDADYALLTRGQSSAPLMAYEITPTRSGKGVIMFYVGRDNAGKDYTVLHKLADGSIEEFHAVCADNGYITVRVNGFSPFAVFAGKVGGGTTGASAAYSGNPDTGANDVVAIAGALAAVALIAAAVISRKKD